MVWTRILIIMPFAASGVRLVCYAKRFISYLKCLNQKWSLANNRLGSIQMNGKSVVYLTVICSYGDKLNIGLPLIKYHPVKNFGGEKTLVANLENFSNSPSFLPIFTISTALLMVLQFSVAHQC